MKTFKNFKFKINLISRSDEPLPTELVLSISLLDALDNANQIQSGLGSGDVSSFGCAENRGFLLS